jgi:hypothetical protein
MAKKPFANVAQFRYLETTETNQNLIQEDITRTLNLGNACYHSVQNLLSSCLSKNVKIKIHKTVILHVVLYGCETWSLTLREEHRLRVFENRVLKRIFGLKRNQVTVHNEELHNLYSSPSIIRIIKSRRIRWAWYVTRMGEKRNALVEKSEGKRQLGRPRCRWVDNIKMDGVVWTGWIWLRIWTSRWLS